MVHIRAHIEDKLAPGRCVKLDPYKVNVYGEGGFFKPHVDNPSDHNMIGSLVICLPSPHKGGELLVNHEGLQHVFEFSKHSGDTSRIQWAAFYSDCIHEVKPIVEGHRVTITYSIIALEWSPKYHQYTGRYTEHEDAVSLQEHFECSEESPPLTTKALTNVKTELEKIQSKTKRSPSKVGFLLKHKYTTKGLQPRLLKGEDKGLNECFADKEWKYELMSVLTRYQTDEVRPYGPFEDGDLDESHEVYEFKPLKSIKPPSVYGSLERSWRSRKNFRQWRVGIPFVEIYRKTDNSAQIVRNNEGSGSWIGNEVEDIGVDKIYLDSALIVQLCRET